MFASVLIEALRRHVKVLNFQVFDPVTQRFVVIPQLDQFCVDVVNRHVTFGGQRGLIVACVILIVASKFTELCIGCFYLLLDWFGNHALDVIGVVF